MMLLKYLNTIAETNIFYILFTYSLNNILFCQNPYTYHDKILRVIIDYLIYLSPSGD